MSSPNNTRAVDGLLDKLYWLRFHAMNLNIADLPSVDMSAESFDRKLPHLPCVYFVLDSSGQAVYVGKAVNLRFRWVSHHCLKNAEDRTDMKLAWLELPPAYLATLEAIFILTIRPKWNQKERFDEGDFYFPGDPEKFADYWEDEDDKRRRQRRVKRKSRASL